ncbi:hypothetical protein HOLleu_04236 [Holothuria leucospilota]|uniref:Uncharacterized protein n=1 Tax=Holothuria leucospilota TaxID=206669 RepID=A0A9Q1CUC3_HOLLE|nr:hypothetical protein HOLleu_04236 [Holothuria leucospilota]
MTFEGNCAANYKRWIQALERYFVASGVDKKLDSVKIANLLHIGGERMISIYNAFQWDNDDDVNKYDKVKEKFSRYFEPRKNLTYLRYQFFTRSQKEGEKIDSFITDLRNKAKDCELATFTESLIRDRLICGSRDDSVRCKLLRVDKLTLEQAINTCRANEAATAQLTELSHDQGRASDIHEVKSRPIAKKTCGKCGRQHKYGECPAVGKTCRRCGRANHFECVCRTKLAQDGSNQWSNRSSKGSGEKSNSRSAGKGQFRSRQSTKRRSNEAKAGKEVHVLDRDSTTSDSEEESHFFIDSVDSVDNANKTEDHWKV